MLDKEVNQPSRGLTLPFLALSPLVTHWCPPSGPHPVSCLSPEWHFLSSGLGLPLMIVQENCLGKPAGASARLVFSGAVHQPCHVLLHKWETAAPLAHMLVLSPCDSQKWWPPTQVRAVEAKACPAFSRSNRSETIIGVFVFVFLCLCLLRHLGKCPHPSNDFVLCMY